MELKKYFLILVLAVIAIVVAMVMMPTASADWPLPACGEISVSDPINGEQECAQGTCSSGHYCAMVHYGEDPETGYSCECTPEPGTCDNWLWPDCGDGGCGFGGECTSQGANLCECMGWESEIEILEPVPCYDSDGGEDYYTAGFAKVIEVDHLNRARTHIEEDSCYTSGSPPLEQVLERYCDPEYGLRTVAFDCAEGCEDGACAEAYCSDNTLGGYCSETKPLYCNEELELVPGCDTNECGCPEGYACDTQTDECVGLCSDGTYAEECSEFNVGQYCTASQQLVDACWMCPCGTHETCDADDKCYDDCNRGGSWIDHGTCDINNEPERCYAGDFIDWCNICDCPTSAPVCEGDGTCRDYYDCGSIEHDNCNPNNKPKKCNDGTFEDDCNFCNCPPSTPKCNQDGSCTQYASCGSTPHGQCVSGNKPKKCVDGTLVDDCQTCDCPPPYTYCFSDGTCGY